MAGRARGRSRRCRSAGAHRGLAVGRSSERGRVAGHGPTFTGSWPRPGRCDATPRKAGAAGARSATRRSRSAIASLPASSLLLPPACSCCSCPASSFACSPTSSPPSAEVRSVALDDGSVVMLGADSAIAVRYQDARRRRAPAERRGVLSGSARCPASLQGRSPRCRGHGAGHVVQRAAGRRRRRRGRGDGGRRAGRECRREPGDLACNSNRATGRGSAGRAWSSAALVQTDEVAPWLHGQIVARDRAMADVVDELRRYYRGMIVVADDSLRGRRVTGVYNLADPKEALERDRRRTRRVGAAGVALVAGRPRQLIRRKDHHFFAGEKSDAAVVA